MTDEEVRRMICEIPSDLDEDTDDEEDSDDESSPFIYGDYETIAIIEQESSEEADEITLQITNGKVTTAPTSSSSDVNRKEVVRK